MQIAKLVCIWSHQSELSVKSSLCNIISPNVRQKFNSTFHNHSYCSPKRLCVRLPCIYAPESPRLHWGAYRLIPWLTAVAQCAVLNVCIPRYHGDQGQQLYGCIHVCTVMFIVQQTQSSHTTTYVYNNTTVTWCNQHNKEYIRFLSPCLFRTYLWYIKSNICFCYADSFQSNYTEFIPIGNGTE